jgi:hypothetical protein
MRRFKRATTLITAGAFMLTACATTGPKGEPTFSSPEACIVAHTAGGAVAGAITGALIGAIAGSNNKKEAKKDARKGAAIGAVGGGVVAFAYAWGACFSAYTKVKSEQTKRFDEAQVETGYSAQQGVVTKINNYTFDPTAVAPGDNPTLNATYYVMTPTDNEISVTETVTLKFYNPEKKIYEELPSASETIVAHPGIRNATSEIHVPSSAEEGKFLIVFTVEAMGTSDRSEMPFIITSNQQTLANARQASAVRQAKAEEQKSAIVVASANGTGYVQGEKSVQVTSATETTKIETATIEKQITIVVSKATIRENPDPRSKVMVRASINEKYPLLNTVTISGRTWYQVRLADGKPAWVLGSFAKVTE